MGHAFACIVLVCLGSLAAAQDFGGFGTFQKEPINAPGSYKVIADPTGAGPTAKAHSFLIESGACSNKKYTNGNSDCSFNSVRAQAYESGKKQPAEAWYGWWLFLDPGFPIGKAQKAGGTYSFAYWHNGECPNLDIGIAENSTKLFLQSNIFGGPGQCNPDQRISLGDAAAMRGRWHRFEVHVKWSKGSDGLAEVFIDGHAAGTLKGRNISLGAPNKNYFKFGIYLHGTKGTELIVPARAYFAGLARSGTRGGLEK